MVRLGGASGMAAGAFLAGAFCHAIGCGVSSSPLGYHPEEVRVQGLLEAPVVLQLLVVLNERQEVLLGGRGEA